MCDYFREGFEACYRGAKRISNPHDRPGNYKACNAWERGFCAAKREIENAERALSTCRDMQQLRAASQR